MNTAPTQPRARWGIASATSICTEYSVKFANSRKTDFSGLIGKVKYYRQILTFVLARLELSETNIFTEYSVKYRTSQRHMLVKYRILSYTYTSAEYVGTQWKSPVRVVRKPGNPMDYARKSRLIGSFRLTSVTRLCFKLDVSRGCPFQNLIGTPSKKETETIAFQGKEGCT